MNFNNVYPNTRIFFNNDVVILPCPYCGARAVVYVMSTGNLLVGCPNSEWDSDCHCRGGHKDIYQSIKEWNEDVKRTLKEMTNNDHKRKEKN